MTALNFAVLSAVILLTPGPTNTLLAAAGAARGFRRTWLLPLAESLGYALAVSAFAAGCPAPWPACLGRCRR